jgi:hypothetical protein
MEATHVSRVRIKYFGLIPMTRFAYLVALAATGGIALFIVVVGAILGLLPPMDTMWSRENHLPAASLEAWLYDYFYWFVFACLMGQVIDIYRSLRQFARKEQQQRALFEELLRQTRADGGTSLDRR